MANGLLEKLRGARGFELFAALALAALLALMLLGQNGGSGSRKTALESRVEDILSRVEGAGRVSAMINQGEDGTVTGALIVADGLEDVGTYLRLQRAVASLLDVDVESIEIIGRSGMFGGGL